MVFDLDDCGFVWEFLCKMFFLFFSFSLVTFKAANSYIETLNVQLLLPPKTSTPEKEKVRSILSFSVIIWQHCCLVPEWMDNWIDEWIDGWMDACMDGGGWMDRGIRWINGWMSEWIDGCIDEWIDGYMDEWIWWVSEQIEGLDGWIDELRLGVCVKPSADRGWCNYLSSWGQVLCRTYDVASQSFKCVSHSWNFGTWILVIITCIYCRLACIN